MSQAQAEAAIVEVGNSLFNRRWKCYDVAVPQDCNILPAESKMRRMEPRYEVMALASIVHEIIESENATVTYSTDGSSMNQVVSYVVQSFIITGEPRVSPAFSIFTESRSLCKN